MTTEKTAGLSVIRPLATMQEAWAEGDRLRAEGCRLRAESDRLRAEGRRLGARLQAEAARLRAEGDRLRAEGDRLWAESDLIVILTALALYGPDVQINWGTHEVESLRKQAQAQD